MINRKDKIDEDNGNYICNQHPETCSDSNCTEHN